MAFVRHFEGANQMTEETYHWVRSEPISEHHPFTIRIVFIITDIRCSCGCWPQSLVAVTLLCSTNRRRAIDKFKMLITQYFQVKGETYLLMGSTMPAPSKPRPCPSFHPNFCSIWNPNENENWSTLKFRVHWSIGQSNAIIPLLFSFNLYSL